SFAAPLSRPLSSRNTSCICSTLGLAVSHSRTRAARSPEVGAENAPPVSASSERVSLGLRVAWVTAVSWDRWTKALTVKGKPLFSPRNAFGHLTQLRQLT